MLLKIKILSLRQNTLQFSNDCDFITLKKAEKIKKKISSLHPRGQLISDLFFVGSSEIYMLPITYIHWQKIFSLSC